MSLNFSFQWTLKSYTFLHQISIKSSGTTVVVMNQQCRDYYKEEEEKAIILNTRV